MQMFGVGILELIVILMLIVIVVGPDRMPQVAADLARWIRQARAYSRHLMGDFNSVVSDMEKEANINRDDWKEIASVVSRNTGEIGKELNRVIKDADVSGDLEAVKEIDPSSHSNGNGANGDAATEPEAQQPEGSSEAESAEEKPWYEPEKTPRASRRRSSE